MKLLICSKTTKIYEHSEYNKQNELSKLFKMDLLKK